MGTVNHLTLRDSLDLKVSGGEKPSGIQSKELSITSDYWKREGKVASHRVSVEIVDAWEENYLLKTVLGKEDWREEKKNPTRFREGRQKVFRGVGVRASFVTLE